MLWDYDNDSLFVVFREVFLNLCDTAHKHKREVCRKSFEKSSNFQKKTPFW
jgi:hypothetical protein